MTATRTRPRWWVATLAVVAVAIWVVGAVLLWRTSVPGSLDLPDLAARDYFTASELAETAHYQRFIRVDVVLSLLATIVALVVLMRRAPRIARNTGLGPIGAGVIVSMIMIAVLWAVDLPFAVAIRWWQKRHDLVRGSWLEWLVQPWAELGALVVLVMLQVVVVMAFARRYPRNWWLPVTPIFLALATVYIFLLPYLLAGRVHGPSRPQLRQDVRALERREGVDVPVDVEKKSKVTKQANAFAFGLGPTERVVLWDTLLDEPFTRGEVRIVLAHEFGHIGHRHLLKGMGWSAIFAFPLAFALARITARRGGLGDPGLLPYGVLVLVLLNVAITPLTNVVSRRYEAEADWAALQAARDPESQKALMQKFSEPSLSQPNPPTWWHVFSGTHPTLMQRIAMAQAWEESR